MSTRNFGTQPVIPTFKMDTKNWLVVDEKKNSTVDSAYLSASQANDVSRCGDSIVEDVENYSDNSEYFDAKDDKRPGDGVKGLEKPGSDSEEEEEDFREKQKQKLSERLQNSARAGARKWTWLRVRYECGCFVNGPRIQLLIIALIVSNALTMGVSTFYVDNPDVTAIFKTIDNAFLYIYTAESIMQFIYFGWRMILDGWLAFDLIVVLISWYSDVIMAGSGSTGSFQIIRAFRIFRALRLLTRIKVLRDLVAAIGQVIPRLLAILMLLTLIMFIFAVLFTELFNEMVLEDFFGEGEHLYPFESLHMSFFTCWEIMLLEWSVYAREAMLMKQCPTGVTECDDSERKARMASWGWFPFVLFIFISGFIIFNLVIAVICDAVAEVEENAELERAKERGVILQTEVEQVVHCKDSFSHLNEKMDTLEKTQNKVQKIMNEMVKDLTGGAVTKYHSDLNTLGVDDDEKLTSNPYKRRMSKSSRRKQTTSTSQSENI